MASQKPSRARSGQGQADSSGSAGNNSGRTAAAKRGTASGQNAKSGQGTASGQNAKSGQGTASGQNAKSGRTRAGGSGGSGSPGRPGQPAGNASRSGQARPPAAKSAPGPSGGGRQPGNAGPRSAAPPARPAAGIPLQAAAPRWLQLTTLLLSLFGLGVSIYLTIAHYNTKVTLACPDTGLVNCTKVTTSAQSIFLGIPVVDLGLAFFVFMVAANSPWAWRSKLPAIYWARLGSVVVGMLFVLYLVYSEIVTIGNICLFCTSVHVITFLLFALLVFYASSPANRPTRPAAPTSS